MKKLDEFFEGFGMTQHESDKDCTGDVNNYTLDHMA